MNINKFTNLICVMLASILLSNFAQATPIVTSASRYVVVGDSASGLHYGGNSPYTTTGAFFDSITQPLGSRGIIVSASQTSAIDTAGGTFSGSGDISVGFSALADDNILAQSIYTINFDLATDHLFSLTGNLDTGMDGGLGISQLQLLGPTGLLYTATNYELITMHDSGTLSAGSYQLLVSTEISRGQQTSGYMGGLTSFDFNMQLTELTSNVPEPASLFLLAIGLLGLGLSYRKRRD